MRGYRYIFLSRTDASNWDLIRLMKEDMWWSLFMRIFISQQVLDEVIIKYSGCLPYFCGLKVSGASSKINGGLELKFGRIHHD